MAKLAESATEYKFCTENFEATCPVHSSRLSVPLDEGVTLVFTMLVEPPFTFEYVDPATTANASTGLPRQ